MTQFHGQRRPPLRAPPPDLASAVAAITGLDPTPPPVGSGGGQAPGGRGRGRGSGRGRGVARRGTKRGGAAVAVGERPADGDSEGSPAKKSRLAENSTHLAAASADDTFAPAVCTVPGLPARESDLEDEEDSQVSSIEVELPARRPPSPVAAARASANNEQEQLIRAEKRLADLEAAMGGGGGVDALIADRKPQPAVTRLTHGTLQPISEGHATIERARERAGEVWGDEAGEVEEGWLLGEGQEGALRERGDALMLQDMMLASSSSPSFKVINMCVYFL